MDRRNENILNFVSRAVEHIAEVNEGIESNSVNAENASFISQKTVRNAEQGNITLQETVETVAHISEGSNHILRVVDIIEAIAMNTNLLALNAAVEAARAGAAGKSLRLLLLKCAHWPDRLLKLRKILKGCFILM